MIRIREDKPTKISGVTSLYLSFPFNEEAIKVIKTCTKYVFDKNTKCWELPINELAYLLDNLTYIDDITLELQNEDTTKTHFYPKLIDQYKTKPFKHQLEGIEYGLNIDSWLLLDDPGLGKTLQMIYLAEELKAQKGLEHCLIICGINSLKSNWEEEIRKHSNETVRILGKKVSKKGNISYGSIKERAAELMNPFDSFFIITNIESLRSTEFVEALKKTKNKIGMVVLDEAHKCKNPSSQQGHNLLKLTNYEHKIALTGTLIVNRPIDAFSALKWIGVEHATLTNFKSQYCVFGGFGGYQIVGYQNTDILKEEISSCSLRRLKSEIKDLPPKHIIPEILEMNDSHRKLYENIVNGIKEQCDKVQLNTNNMLGMTTRLQQAATCPSILTTESIPSTKIERAVEITEDLIQNGEKVVIMSTMKQPLRELFSLLKEYNPLMGTGDQKQDEFDRNKKLFQEDPKYKVFLGTTDKAGTGLTLNAASYLIALDMEWTAALQKQVEDRIHRIDNKSTAIIYRLICQGTIDEQINEIVADKDAISGYIIDDKIDDSARERLLKYIQDL